MLRIFSLSTAAEPKISNHAQKDVDFNIAVQVVKKAFGGKEVIRGSQNLGLTELA